VIDLNLPVAEAMVSLFLKAVEKIDSDLFNQREQFIKYYIYMLADFAETPHDEWIPKFFQYASQESKDCFASRVKAAREARKSNGASSQSSVAGNGHSQASGEQAGNESDPSED
jgi:hypothetical protein